MISNFIFSKIFRIVRSDDIGHMAHWPPPLPQIMYSKPTNDNQMWYVCIEKYSNDKEKIHGFDCMRFDSYKDAQDQKMNLCQDVNVGLRKTIIPVCKWTPRMFHSFIIGYKLKNMYWKNRIDVYSNSSNSTPDKDKHE